jgi:hypothetical protein
MSIPAGRWIITSNVRFPNAVSYAGLSISSTNNVEDLNSESVVSLTGTTILQVTRVVTVSSGSQTWYLVATSGGANTLTNTTFDGFRLA